MAERPKLLYVIVHDDAQEENVDRDWGSRKRFPSSRYTRAVLQSTLQFMGCKARHAFKISVRVFDVLRAEPPSKVFEYHGCPVQQQEAADESGSIRSQDYCDTSHSMNPSCRKPPKPSKKRSMVVVSRDRFLDVVCDALAQYQYVGPNQRADLTLACRFRERKSSLTVLLCGTSGCGKSTLSSLLASRLGITTVVSTDSIRHMMRGFADQKSNPLLWASTYHAGEFLDPVAIKEATERRKNAMASNPTNTAEDPEVNQAKMQSDSKENTGEGEADTFSSKTMVIQGFKAQCEMVIDSLDRLITSWEQRNESVVVEGVHLSLNFVMGLMRKHPSIVPFMIYISNEEKHLERFAVRAKYMTLDPSKNKYAKYIRNIRTIQEYLCKRADKHLVPKVNNTNVDKSVAGIHATIFSCLRRREAGEPLYDQATNTVKLIDQEYQNQYAASSLGSKCMFQMIQRKGSTHHLMALMNVDGSVAKAWPIESGDGTGKSGNNGDNGPVYGPLQIGKAEPVNLHFGNFGLSAFPSEAGETSSSGGGDTSSSSKVDSHEFNTSSRSSLSSSSPRHVEVADKEAVDETAVFVSEEEQEEDNLSVDSDEELADDREEHMMQDEEMEGSISESSVRSDEELDTGFGENEDGYWSGEETPVVEPKKQPELRRVSGVRSPRGTRKAVVRSAEEVGEYIPSSKVRQQNVPCAKQVLHNRTKSMPVLGTQSSDVARV